ARPCPRGHYGGRPKPRYTGFGIRSPLGQTGDGGNRKRHQGKSRGHGTKPSRLETPPRSGGCRRRFGHRLLPSDPGGPELTSESRDGYIGKVTEGQRGHPSPEFLSS